MKKSNIRNIIAFSIVALLGIIAIIVVFVNNVIAFGVQGKAFQSFLNGQHLSANNPTAKNSPIAEETNLSNNEQSNFVSNHNTEQTRTLSDWNNIHLTHKYKNIDVFDSNTDYMGFAHASGGNHYFIHDNTIYQQSLSGKNKPKVLYSAQGVSQLNVIKDYAFFYTTDSANDNTLYSMHLDTLKVKKIGIKSLDYIILEDYIYYISSDTGESSNSRLFRCKLDGSQNQQVSISEYRNLSYHDGWIFYVDGNKDNQYASLHRSKADGTFISQLAYEKVISFNINQKNGDLYFLFNQKGAKGSTLATLKEICQPEIIRDFPDVVWKCVHIYNGDFYSYDDQGNLCKVDLNSGKTTTLLKSVSDMTVVDNYLYCNTKNEKPSGLVKINLDTNIYQFFDAESGNWKAFDK